jgi:hypothetical protein
MAQTQQYDCIVCGAHFESSKDLLRHNQSEHLANATGMEKPRTTDPQPSDLPEREPPEN